MHNKFFWAAIAWTVFVTVICLVSSSSLSSMDVLELPNKDKVLHFAFYFVFTVFWFLFFREKFGRSIKLNIGVFVFATVYGGLIEIFQLLTSAGRSADVMDAIANAMGSAAAILCIWIFTKFKK